MRLIHTSDWHLGQSFYTKSRAAEHEAFLDWLIAEVREREVDAVIVAGDVFDTGTPPSYARELYNRFIVGLQQTGCQLVVLGGNHDAVSTLNESRGLLACLNTRVIPGAMATLDEQVLVLRRQGEPAAILCAVPFLRPRDVLVSLAGQSGQEKQASLRAAIAAHYAALHAHALALRESLNRQLPIITTGHLATVGSTRSESVREIYIGSLEAFPVSGFPPADYIALGHIHKSQKVGGATHIRYSGSPIPLSFDEIDQAKTVLVADFDDSGLLGVEEVEVPRFQPMVCLRGSLDEIACALSAFAAGQEGPPVWLDIEVSRQDYADDLRRRVESLIEGLPVEIVQLRRARTQSDISLAQADKETLGELSVEEVFSRRMAQEAWETPEEVARAERLTNAFRQVVEEVRLPVVAAGEAS